MKTMVTFLFLAALNLQAMELVENQYYVSKSKNEVCEDFKLVKSKNPHTPSWLLGPSIIFFDAGFKLTDRSNCLVEKNVEEQKGAWIQTTKAHDCEEASLGYSRVERLSVSENNELIYSSEITYDDQKDQVQRLSCRFVKKASKAN